MAAPKKDRYALTAPVPHGEQFWLIHDTEKELELACISAHFPDAERVARDLLFKLEESTADEAVAG